MEFKIEKKNILEMLTKVQGITGKKTNIPITSSVLITAKENFLNVSATDLEIAFQGQYEAEVLKEGSNAIPSRKFYEIVKDFPSDMLAVKELDNKWIHIVDNKVEYNIVGMEPDDFPEIPSLEGVQVFELDCDVLRNMMEKTVYAVFKDEGRVHIAGVFFETIKGKDNDVLRMVSTDGHRLAKVDQPVEKGKFPLLKQGVIIPKAGVVEVLKILESGSRVRIGIRDNNFIAKRANEGLIIRLIDGEFPDYDLVIPKSNESELSVNRDDFLMMLKRMSILSSDKYRSVVFKIGKQQMETITTNPEVGESREVIPVTYNGEDIELAFNPMYFVDSVSRMSSEQVIIKIKDEATPCLIFGEKDPTVLSVIMPMRI